MVDHLSRIPGELLRHATECLNSPNQAVRAAFLTGIAVGTAQGKEMHHQALEDGAQNRAEQFVRSLGDPPRSIAGYDYPLTDEQRAQMFPPPAQAA